MTKEELRKQMKLIRKLEEAKERKSEIIFLSVINHPVYKEANTVALYNSLPEEVDTNDLIQFSLRNKEVVLLPKVVGDQIVFVRIHRGTRYRSTSFQIQEPMEDEIYQGPIDLAIVPGVAFTKGGDRLGFGGGYYDRFLQDHPCKKMGICFESQIVEEIPTEKNDIQMDTVITEAQVYTDDNPIKQYSL